jgi:putative transposase
MDVFRSDDDRRLYLKLLAEQAQLFGLKFFSYCLMTNHVHLIVVPREADALARAVGEAHRLYTRAFNFRERVRGYLFQGRFHSCPLDDRHLIAALRYVERNPVRAGMVKEAWAYPWSSAAFHVGLREADPLVRAEDRMAPASEWRAMLRGDPNEIEFLRQRVRTGRPCGGKAFMKMAERLTRRVLRPLPPGRRPKVKKGRKK